MAGFQTWNAQGRLVIQSTERYTTFVDHRTVQVDYPTGNFSPAPFGGTWNDAYWSTEPYWVQPDLLQWFRLAPGAWCFSGGGTMILLPGTVQVIRTSRHQSIQSGYLDVFDPSGNLIWSAASAGNMPRVRDILQIPSAALNGGGIYSVNLSYNPWVLQQACPGNYSDDGVNVAIHGLSVRWTGSQLQFHWSGGYAPSTVYGGGNIPVPLAEFIGR